MSRFGIREKNFDIKYVSPKKLGPIISVRLLLLILPFSIFWLFVRNYSFFGLQCFQFFFIHFYLTAFTNSSVFLVIVSIYLRVTCTTFSFHLINRTAHNKQIRTVHIEQNSSH